MPLHLRAGSMAVLMTLPLAAAHAADTDVKAGDLVIQQPWARSTPNGASVAGAYATILNRGAVADSLTGGSAEPAASFEIHTMSMADGVMRMRPAGPLAVPPGGSVTLSPAGTHIMLTRLKHGLHKGDTFAGTLTFAHAGPVAVRFTVEGIAAQAPGGQASTTGMNKN